jgi:hypothetical protein
VSRSDDVVFGNDGAAAVVRVVGCSQGDNKGELMGGGGGSTDDSPVDVGVNIDWSGYKIELGWIILKKKKMFYPLKPSHTRRLSQLFSSS